MKMSLKPFIHLMRVRKINMRITELFDTDIKTKSGEHDLKSLSKSYRKSYNTGHFSHVENDPEDPHMVIKKSRIPIPLQDDAYYQYVKTAKPFFKSNPFLPRIYSVEATVDKQGKAIPNYRIEKLYSLDDERVTSKVLEAIAMSISPGHGWDEKISPNLEYPSDLEGDNFYSMSKNNMISHIAITIQHYAHGRNKPNVDSIGKTDHSKTSLGSLIRQAIGIFNRVKKGNIAFRFDLHQGNFMVRFTSVGPQLVFTDPLAGDTDDKAAELPPSGSPKASRPQDGAPQTF